MNRQVKHVFYTDDDPDDHYIFEEALRTIRPDAILTPFYSCADIIAYLENAGASMPDIIFLDQNMHGNRGNECVAALKKIAWLEKVPLVIYTTGAQADIRDDAFRLGVFQYVIKPAYHKDITRTLLEVLTACEKNLGP